MHGYHLPYEIIYAIDVLSDKYFICQLVFQTKI